MAELHRLINDMIDGCDAYVREATAAMDAVHHNISGVSCLAGFMAPCCRAQTPSTSLPQALKSASVRIRQFERQTSELEGSVSSIVSPLDNGAAEMSRTAGNLRTGASSTRERITSIASASEQTASDMQSVASATTKLASNASGMGADILRSAQFAGRAVERVTDAAGSVEVLKDVAVRIISITEIGTVIAEVNDITGKVAATSEAQAQATADIARTIDSAFAVVGEIAANIQALAQTAKIPTNSRHRQWRRQATCRRNPAFWHRKSGPIWIMPR
jgi:methyl-accepting chemotaxis protein